jgi:hypothetical protein
MLFSALAAATLALLGSSPAQAGVIPQKRATVCNGHAELCNRSYGNVTYFGSHDSFAFSKDPLALAADQNVDIPTQLGLGVRMLQAQSHKNDLDGEIHFCHTSCLLFDGGKVVDYLKTVKTFLDANPNEVLTFIFTNPEGLDLKTVWAPAFEQSGMDKLAFVPPKPGTPVKQSEWPTLGEMIDSGKRVVVFLDAGADSGAVPYLMPEFQMIWEPPFSVTDPNFPCKVDRIAGPLSTEDHMYMINHNLNTALFGDDDLLVPAKSKAKTTNGVPSILANANGCTPIGGNRAPSFLLLDFVDVGEGQKAANLLNGLPA